QHRNPICIHFPYTTLFRSAEENEVKIPRRGRRVGASGTHFLTYSSGSNVHRGSSFGKAISGCTTVSVISLEETRCPFSSSTTTEDRKSTRLNSSHVKISYA